MIEAELTTLVLADDDVEALVGTRMYPIIAPQNSTLPYIIYRRLSTSRPTTHDDSAGYAQAIVQLTVWADKYDEAKGLAEEVRQVLDCYNANDWDNHDVSGVLVLDEKDVASLPEAAGEVPLFGVQLDVEVMFSEPQEA